MKDGVGVLYNPDGGSVHPEVPVTSQMHPDIGSSLSLCLFYFLLLPSFSLSLSLSLSLFFKDDVFEVGSFCHIDLKKKKKKKKRKK